MNSSNWHHTFNLTIVRYTSVISVLLILISCTSNIKSTLTEKGIINEIVIRNLSGSDIKDVTLRVEKIHGIFECSQIITNTECSTSFRKKEFENNKVKITWKLNGKSYSSGEIYIIPSRTLDRKRLMKGIVVVGKNNQMSAYLTN